MKGTHLQILELFFEERFPKFLWKPQLLVHRAKHVLSAVGAFEAQIERLAESAPLRGSKPPCETRQVQKLDLDGRVPQIAVAATE